MIAPFFFWVWISPNSTEYRFEIVGVLWSYIQWADSGFSGSGFMIFDTLSVPLALLLSLFRFEFIIVIRKHQRGQVRKKIVWLSAILSQLPMVLLLFTPLFMNGLGGPIPILLILGLFIDRKIGVEPPVVPWEDESSGIEK